MIGSFCLFIALVLLTLGLVLLSSATLGVGLISTACFWLICARLAQADLHQRQLIAAIKPDPVTTHQPLPNYMLPPDQQRSSPWKVGLVAGGAVALGILVAYRLAWIFQP